MIYDPDLVEQLSRLATKPFRGIVYRATSEKADPTAPSIYGGRWARPQNKDSGTSALYTSIEKDGALAEVSSLLLEQTPIPGPRELKVTRLEISTKRTLHLLPKDFAALGIDQKKYGERDYRRTQEIGSTLAWLGHDGLIAPSARWQCETLTIFTDNHPIDEKLEPVDQEMIEWRAWAKAHGLLD